MMIAMTLGSMLITRKLATERTISRWQSALEMIVTGIEGQIKEVGLDEPRKYLAFLGTLFLFIGRAAYASSFLDSSRLQVHSQPRQHSRCASSLRFLCSESASKG